VLLKSLRFSWFVLIFSTLTIFALTPSKAKTPITLADGRTSNRQSVQVSPSIADQILHQLFPGEWKGVAPELKGAVQGSFTKKKANEIFAMGFKFDPSVDHAGEFGHWRCGVFSEGKPIVISESLGHIGKCVFRKLDLDGDGVDEILTLSDGMAHGYSQAFLGIVSAKDAEIRGLISFPLSASEAATGRSQYSEDASVVVYTGGSIIDVSSYAVRYYSKKYSETSSDPKWTEQKSPWWESQ
jgi:hypothetical protein